MKLRFRVMVTEGPVRGSFILRSPVQGMSVGRASDCKVAIADPSMSRSHFTLSWDGRECRLTTLNTTNGTAVNGFPVKETLLRNGDSVIAGDTIFKVFIERDPDSNTTTNTATNTATQKQASYARLQPLPIFEHLAVTHPIVENKLSKKVKKSSLLDKLVDVVKADETAHWYAIIDGAKAASLAYQAKTMGYSVYTLFMGETAQDFDLASVGPCVVNLDKPLPFLEQWVAHMGESIGVLLQTEAELDVLYAHLRNLFIARDEQGDDYYFRYYDPRILRVYLPTCTDGELKEFFGAVKKWLSEGDTLDSLCNYTLYEKKLEITNYVGGQ